MKLDRSKPFATIYGHDQASYQQNDILFNGADEPLGKLEDMEFEPVNVPGKDTDLLIETDKVASAEAFLRTLLQGGPIKKAVVKDEADRNNQQWDDVQSAAALMGLQKITQGTGAVKWELWKLPVVEA